MVFINTDGSFLSNIPDASELSLELLNRIRDEPVALASDFTVASFFLLLRRAPLLWAEFLNVDTEIISNWLEEFSGVASEEHLGAFLRLELLPPGHGSNSDSSDEWRLLGKDSQSEY